MQRTPMRQCHRAVAAALALLLTATAPGTAAGEIAPADFLASEGAQAFKANDFERALDGFTALLSDYPGDATILRYLGITLDRLGRHDEAVEAFRQALAADPDNVPALFFLGVSEYNRANFAAARSAFEQVAARAADTDYGARAREFLTAIDANAPIETAPPAGRRWDVYVQLALQYDDNVVIAPDGTPDTETLRSTEYLRAGYRLIDSDGTNLRAEASGYFSQNWMNDHSDRNFQFGEAAVTLDHAAALGEVSLVPSLRYGLTGTWLDTEEFLVGHRLRAAADIGWTTELKTSVFYGLSLDDYNDDGVVPVVTSRDGVTNEAGLTQTLVFDLFDRASSVHVGYTFTDRDADGINHDSRAHLVRGGVTLGLPESLTLDLSGYVGWDRYPSFSGPLGVRETDIRGASATLSRPLTENIHLSLSYAYRREDSNYPTLDHDRNIVTVSVGYSF